MICKLCNGEINVGGCVISSELNVQMLEREMLFYSL